MLRCVLGKPAEPQVLLGCSLAPCAVTIGDSGRVANQLCFSTRISSLEIGLG